MHRIINCIRDQHDARLVLLAFLICLAASLAAVLLLRHARGSGGTAQPRWLLAAGMASGFGIWATHFVAMLGYGRAVLGYALAPTLGSLGVAAVATSFGFLLALRSARPGMRWAAGAVVGLGIAAMHYLGMEAMLVPGRFLWKGGYVAASIAFAILPIPFALGLALDRRDAMSAVGGGLLFAVAILLLHFTGMAGIAILPGRIEDPGSPVLSPVGLAIAVAATAFVVLALCTFSALLSGRARATILATEREFNVLVQGIRDCAIYMLGPDGRVVSWNAGAERLKGYAAVEVIGQSLAIFHAPEERASGQYQASLAAARRDGRFNGEGWRYRKDGSRFWAHVTIEAVYDAAGAFLGFAKITRDMTRLKEDQDRLRALTANLDAALSNMHQGLCLFDADERLVISNERVGTIFGITRAECPAGTRFEEVLRVGVEQWAGGPVDAQLLADVLARHRACIAQPGGGTLVVPFTHGTTVSIDHRPMPGGGWVSTFDDISERRRAAQRIEHMALHDDLTGLPNRAHYTARLRDAIAQADQGGGMVAVIGIDLDRFKEINDVHGHATGDAVLRLLSERMAATLAPGETVARFGGDEFAALKTYAEEAELIAFATRLHGALTAPVTHEALTIFPGASLGVATYPADGRTLEQILSNADLAMYRAKETVGRGIFYYEKGMDEAARARRRIASDLRDAIAGEELSLVYQVQRSVTTEAVIGYEALLRWRHPRDGWISPAEFIPIAEESGEILRIGEWVLRTACREAAAWPEAHRVAVNLSPVQLMHVDLVGIVTRALVDSGLPPRRLELEITETALIADRPRALHILRQIKALGVTIAIDDFGTGYASLDTLNAFPFDKIKIDKSFLLESDRSHQARAIIRAVLALGRSLEVPVLAEGLETEGQLRLLRHEGCEQAQGYLWGRPMPIAFDGVPMIVPAARAI